MTAQSQTKQWVFRVLDSVEAPNGGCVLRLRLQDGEAPTVKALKGARLLVRSPDGNELTVRVQRFALVGGKPSDGRLARTGRVDIQIEKEGDADLPIPLRSEVEGPLD
jgi:hypothetical protein